MSKERPAQKTLEFAVIGSNNYKAQRGHHSTNLFDKLQVDLQNAEQGPLRSGKRLSELRSLTKRKHRVTSNEEKLNADCCGPVKGPEERHQLGITWNKYIERKYKYSIGKECWTSVRLPKC